MPRFAANLTFLFTEVPALERPDLAAQAGFEGAEILFPYDIPATEWKTALNGMPLALINTPPGDWALGERGLAAVPPEVRRFRDGFLRAADYASHLGAQCVHVMSGVGRGPGCEQVFCENLIWAAEQAPELRLSIEPVNIDDMPGYFLNDFDQAARLIDDLALPTLGLQFDLWHAARIHGDANTVWTRHGHRVSHIQIAGFPSRAEPGGGGFDLPGLCTTLDAGEWSGWISAEYIPARATVHGLAWLQALKSRNKPIGL